jgi:hypothetical protein
MVEWTSTAAFSSMTVVTILSTYYLLTLQVLVEKLLCAGPSIRNWSDSYEKDNFCHHKFTTLLKQVIV